MKNNSAKFIEYVEKSLERLDHSSFQQRIVKVDKKTDQEMKAFKFDLQDTIDIFFDLGGQFSMGEIYQAHKEHPESNVEQLGKLLNNEIQILE